MKGPSLGHVGCLVLQLVSLLAGAWIGGWVSGVGLSNMLLGV